MGAQGFGRSGGAARAGKYKGGPGSVMSRIASELASPGPCSMGFRQMTPRKDAPTSKWAECGEESGRHLLELAKVRVRGGYDASARSSSS